MRLTYHIGSYYPVAVQLNSFLDGQCMSNMPLEPRASAPTVSALNQHGMEITPSFDDPTVVYLYLFSTGVGCRRISKVVSR
jgi:hypothetical protein